MMGTRRRWMAYWGAWTVLGLYMATMDAVQMPSIGPSFFNRWLPLNLLQNLVMGLAGLGILAMARRWPLEGFRLRDWRLWLLHGTGSVLLAVLGIIAIWAISILFLEDPGRTRTLAMPLRALQKFAIMYFHVYLLLMWVVFGAFHTLRIFEKFRQRELEASQLETKLSQAQNQALRMQLQPHFLFNTLNSISALVHCDPEGADRMISRLASLLRMTLDLGTQPEVPLQQELAFVDAYLAIEAIRFQDRLEVRRHVDSACLPARVPVFLLQPLVENAIKHGVADLARPCTIEVRASRDGSWLQLEVVDDGRGFEGSGQGIGTRNTATRLELLYPGRHLFRLESRLGHGARAVIRIPFVPGGGVLVEAP